MLDCFRPLLPAAVMVFVSLGGCDGEVSAGDLGGEPIMLELHTLKDPGSRNMDSHTILAPKGWKVEGGAFWAPKQFFRVHPSQSVTITGSDGRFIQISPMLAATDIIPSPRSVAQGFRRPAEGSVDSGKPVVYLPTSAQEWGQWVKKHGIVTPYPNAKNIQLSPVADVPSLTRFVQMTMQPIRKKQAQAAAAIGARPTAFADGAGFCAHATYEIDGKEWEQLWVWMVGFVGDDSAVGRQIFWTIEPNVTFRAPAGELKGQMPLLMTIVNSLRPTREWALMKGKHIARMDGIDVEAFVERTTTQAQFSSDMQKIISQTHANTQEIRDKGHETFMQGFREVDNFVESGSGKPPIQMPIHFKHIWRSENGNVYISNNANDDPRVGSPETWKQLERAAP